MSEPFTYRRRIQFAETDAAGVLHFSNYYRLMEEAEHAFWRAAGSSVIYREGEHIISWPRVQSACEYLGPIHFEDEIELHLKIVGIGAKSYTLEVEFMCGGERRARGRVKAACCVATPGSFRSIEIPRELRGLLEQYKVVSSA